MFKVITSLQHPLVKHIVRLRQNRDYRYDHSTIIVEGSKPIAELSRSNRFKLLAVRHEAMVPIGAEADQIIVVNEAVMTKLSGVCSPEGIIAEMEMPKQSSLKGMSTIVALDHIADPGNVGAILRTALALGWEGVFFVGDGCDPFNEKALRAARGATFHLPYRFGTWEELQQLTKENQLTPYVADIDGKPLKTKPKKCLLVLSNESRGPSDESLKFCEKVAIPMPGGMESLNVAIAGGILMYALKTGFLGE